MLQLGRYNRVALSVRFKLLVPSLSVCGGQSEQVTIVAMPETAVNLDDRAPARQNQIGFTW